MEMKNNVSVTVYSTRTCPYCTMAKDWLTQNGVPFVEFDVSSNNEAAHDMVAKSGQMGVPVIDIGGSIVVGFRPDVFERLLSTQ
jgi:glutaredoxin 3